MLTAGSSASGSVLAGGAVVGAAVLGVVSGGSVVVGSSLASSTAVAGALADVVSSSSLLHAVAAKRQTAAIAPPARVALFMIRSFLSWLEDRNPMIHAWACMGALTGMRMREYCYLREQDVDFSNKTLTITENAAHKPKNLSSHRIIPVCDHIMESLAAWINSLDPKHPDGFLFFPKRDAFQSAKANNPETKAGCYSTDAFSRRFAKAVKEARADDVSLPPKFIARKLRHSFMTAMRGMRSDCPDLQVYCGQSVGTVMSKHYAKPSIERLGKIAGALCQNVGAAPILR